MMLSDRQIREYLHAGKIRVSPSVRSEDIRPTGIRVHLSSKILVPVDSSEPIELDGSRDPQFSEQSIEDRGHMLSRGSFILGATAEIISADADLICQIDGRSTLARIGLMVHCASCIIDHIQAVGRAITLELVNVGPFEINLKPGLPIALITFTRLSSRVQQAAYRQYEGQEGPVAPRLGFRPRDQS